MRVRASDREHGALLGALEHARAVLVEQVVVGQLLGRARARARARVRVRVRVRVMVRVRVRVRFRVFARAHHVEHLHLPLVLVAPPPARVATIGQHLHLAREKSVEVVARAALVQDDLARRRVALVDQRG